MENQKNNLDDVLEILGQAIFDWLPEESTQEEVEAKQRVIDFIDLVADSYVVVGWPKVQELMDEGWFDDEAILDVDCKFGDSAYFIPVKRLIK